MSHRPASSARKPPRHQVRRTTGARRPQRARPRERRRAELPVSTAFLRILGAGLFLSILIGFVAPLRDAARHAGDVVAHATAAGRYAAARDAALISYMVRYGISFELAAAIERTALEEGIDPDLAFRLVRVESRFQERAVSPAGALGLTQLMPGTANELQPGISREEIFDRDTNLRLGFRYLRWLLRHHGGDIEEALHSYNRGPGTVARIRAAGGDPANGYADLVLQGSRLRPAYRGDGLVPTIPPPLPDPWASPHLPGRGRIGAF